MQTVPCPMKDKGICSIPDRTVIASQGSVSIVSRDYVERLFPDLDLDRADLRPLNFTGSYEDLLEAADSLDVIQDEDAGGTLAVAPENERAEELSRALQDAGVTDGVIVNCSCGHQYST
jgi:hypothetical protein